MRTHRTAGPLLPPLTRDAIPSVQEQLLDRIRRADLARSLAEHREPTLQAVEAAPGSHDALRGSREVGSSSVAIRHSRAECALRAGVMATQSRAKVSAARDEASLASAILQIMASREVARGTPSRVRSCLQRPCGALSDHMAPDTSCCDAAATRARIDTEDSALSSCHREAASRVKGHRKVRCS